jgi:transglutaminase-like putative cysteine protease
LFTALARALGIPAQVVVGLVYWPAGHGFGWHAWSEVWNQGKWHAVDPTWNQLAVDATHIKLAGGDPFQQAQIISILSDLKIESLHRE